MTGDRENQSLNQPSSSYIWATVYILVVLIVCSFPLFGLVTGLKSQNLEKRVLAQLPELTVDGAINLRLTRDFDDYYADNFAFRSYLVSAFHFLNQKILKQSGNSKVIAGHSEWLFFSETLPDYLGVPVLSAVQMRRLATSLSLQQEYLASEGIDFHFVVAPNKNSIYGKYMPDRLAPVQSENNLDRWLTGPYRSTVNTIDLLSPLQRAAENSPDPLYHKTDTHWNNLGARISFQTIMAALSQHATVFFYDDMSKAPYATKADWQGDLAVMLYPSGVKPDLQQYFEIPQRYRTSRPMRSLEDLLIQTTLSQADNPEGITGSPMATQDNFVQNAGASRSAGMIKLWMFRDSFANALIPFLASTFSSVTFSREIPYDFRDIDKSKADIVLLEIVERNMPLLLIRAPILPAPEREKPTGKPFSTAVGATKEADDEKFVVVDRLMAERNDNWLKIFGQLVGDQSELDAVEKIYIGLQNGAGRFRYLEATPINEVDLSSDQVVNGTIEGQSDHAPDQQSSIKMWNEDVATIGLTTYLQDDGWKTGDQVLQVWYQANGIWQYQSVQIKLP